MHVNIAYRAIIITYSSQLIGGDGYDMSKMILVIGQANCYK